MTERRIRQLINLFLILALFFSCTLPAFALEGGSEKNEDEKVTTETVQTQEDQKKEDPNQKRHRTGQNWFTEGLRQQS